MGRCGASRLPMGLDGRVEYGFSRAVGAPWLLRMGDPAPPATPGLRCSSMMPCHGPVGEGGDVFGVRLVVPLEEHASGVPLGIPPREEVSLG